MSIEWQDIAFPRSFHSHRQVAIGVAVDVLSKKRKVLDVDKSFSAERAGA
jgi:hypothetical protein